MQHLWISQLSFALSLGYFFFILYLLRNKATDTNNKNYKPDVSVLVPFRNEQDVLAGCIESLKTLNYPKKKLQILLLNDGSEDRSAQIATDAIQGQPNMELVQISTNKDQLFAKMNALAQGIEKARGELIFVTDADCRVQPNWITETVKQYDLGTAMIAGMTVARNHSASPSLFDELQQLDWIYLQSLAIGAANGGKAFTVMGNNLSFRRKVYNDLGGFKTIGFSLDEDHALMQAVANKTNYQIKYILNKEASVFTQTFSHFIDFIQQRQRWAKSGLGARFFAYFLVLLTFAAHLIAPIIFYFQQWGIPSGTAIGLVLGVDYLMLTRSLQILKLDSSKLKFILYEIFLIVYSSLLFITLPFIRRVKWKGRSF